MREELLNALKVIKEECSKHKVTCKGCPMANCNDECGLESDQPSEWRLEKREVYF